MPQISPMNWMMIFMFFIYTIVYMKKSFINEKTILTKKHYYKIYYVK